jgi:ATP-dependent DNA ligase
VIDGEAVFCDGAGIAIFEKLYSRAYDDQVISTPSICWNSTGRTGRPRPLAQRKARLAKLLAKAPGGIQYTEHTP